MGGFPKYNNAHSVEAISDDREPHGVGSCNPHRFAKRLAPARSVSRLAPQRRDAANRRREDMSRHRSSGSYGHSIHRFGPDDFRLHWTVDRYYSGSRLRFPRGASRDTDLAGAKRFTKRWGLQEPTP